MATHPSPTREKGVGPIQFAIIRAIADGAHSYATIRKQVAGKTSIGFSDVILGLQRRGLLHQGRGRTFYLTKEAYAHLPRPDLLIISTGHYKPPVAPPRRPGSDHTHIPSVAAGKLHDYVRHV